jgi:FkbM family methyltransferase
MTTMNLREHSPFWRRAARTLGGRLFCFAENNNDPRFAHNGELWLLRRLLAAHVATRAKGPFVACDAGANVGDYTRHILQEAKCADHPVEVHVFEPSPRCLDALRGVFGDAPAVRIVGAALADRAGEVSLFAGKTGSTLASLVPRPLLAAEAESTLRVPLLLLGDYMKAQAITHIDLLKLDVEGSEMAALRGLGGQLRPEIIDVIQFEYGGATLDAGATLREIYELLAGRGYVLAKLFPHALEVRSYGAWMENYAYANYVALAPRWAASR